MHIRRQKIINTRACEGCPQSFQTLPPHQSQSNDWIFSSLILYVPLTTAASRNVFSHMCRWSSKWRTMVTCVFNSGYWNSFEREGISNKHSKAVKKMCTMSMLLTKALCCRWDLRTAGSEGGHAELSDTRRSGRSTTEVNLSLFQRADELVRNYRRITARKPAAELSASKCSANRIADVLRCSNYVLLGLHEV